MMQQKQVTVKYIDGKYTSAINSLVVDMDYSKDEFISKGFRPTQLSGIPKVSEEYIIANHPEFERDLRSGRLQMVPINAVRWTNDREEYFDEIDYKIVKTPGLPEEQYLVQEEPPRTTNRTPQDDNWRRRQRQLEAAGYDIRRFDLYGVTRNSQYRRPRFDSLDFYHDPIYIFYERRPGNLRRVVLEILAGILETTVVAVALDGREDSRRFEQSFKELAQLHQLSESEMLKRVRAKIEIAKSRLESEKDRASAYVGAVASKSIRSQPRAALL